MVNQIWSVGVKFAAGDLLSASGFQALAHGCDCAGTMSRPGFKERWPAMFAEYAQMCEERKFHVGDVFAWRGEDVVIFNLGLQPHGRAPASLASVEDATRRMLRLAGAFGIDRIGIPRLGGLPWPELRDLLCRLGEATSVELVLFEDTAPTLSTEAPA